MVLLVFANGKSTKAQHINISIYNQFNLKTIILSPIDGRYQFTTDNNKQIKIKKNAIIYFSLVGDSISVWDLNEHLGVFSHIEFLGIGRNNAFKIEPAYPALTSRIYEGDLTLSVENKVLKVNNTVPIESYLAGVVEAESGPNAPFEFYKSQAVISRTYLLELIGRQGESNYKLVDDVSHQVYKGMSLKNPLIKQAVLHTSGLVIIDSTNQLITATFHSNSGGQTLNSEDVWLSATSYLKGTKDPFSLNQRNTNWTDTITVDKWLNYLKDQGFELNNETAKTDNLYFDQPTRLKYYRFNGDTIPLRKIREDFKLRSTWFSFKPEGNIIIVSGRGYGHGVGLSQEGAMQMARENYSFLDIINFYYKNVKVVHFNQILDQTQP
jgi:stage II sporulation protein D